MVEENTDDITVVVNSYDAYGYDDNAIDAFKKMAENWGGGFPNDTERITIHRVRGLQSLGPYYVRADEIIEQEDLLIDAGDFEDFVETVRTIDSWADRILSEAEPNDD